MSTSLWGWRILGTRPPESWKPRVAPTERSKGKWLRGEVHDPRAVAARRGGGARRAVLHRARPGGLCRDDALRRAVRPGAGDERPHDCRDDHPREDIRGQLRGLGWDMASKYSSNRGELFSQWAFRARGVHGHRHVDRPGTRTDGRVPLQPAPPGRRRECERSGGPDRHAGRRGDHRPGPRGARAASDLVNPPAPPCSPGSTSSSATGSGPWRASVSA